MDRIAFVLGDIFLYWNSIVLTLSALTAICFFLAFYLGKHSNGAAAAVAVPMGMVLSVILARLIHWYFQPDGYPGFLGAMTDYTTGGYALLGVFAGCLLTAVILRLIGLSDDLPRMLDAMCLGGCGGIAVGRLACFFNAADRGIILANLKSLPFAYPIVNVVTGQPEYRLATFVIQSMACGVIFLALTLVYHFGKPKKGDITLLFLLLYGMSQTVLDSTRYDSLYMRSNGFISVEQLTGAILVVFVCVMFAIRLVKNRGFRFWYPLAWIAQAGLMGGAGYMEYYVQRHGDLPAFCYSVMTACLSVMVLIALISYGLSRKKQR